MGPFSLTLPVTKHREREMSKTREVPERERDSTKSPHGDTMTQIRSFEEIKMAESFEGFGGE